MQKQKRDQYDDKESYSPGVRFHASGVSVLQDAPSVDVLLLGRAAQRLAARRLHLLADADVLRVHTDARGTAAVAAGQTAKERTAKRDVPRENKVARGVARPLVDLLELPRDRRQRGVALKTEALSVLAVALARLDTFKASGLADQAFFSGRILHALHKDRVTLKAAARALAPGPKALGKIHVTERKRAAQQTGRKHSKL